MELEALRRALLRLRMLTVVAATVAAPAAAATGRGVDLQGFQSLRGGRVLVVVDVLAMEPGKGNITSSTQEVRYVLRYVLEGIICVCVYVYVSIWVYSSSNNEVNMIFPTCMTFLPRAPCRSRRRSSSRGRS